MKKSLTPDQQAAAEARRNKFRSLVQQVAAMDEAERAALASKIEVMTVEGHTLSPTNQVLVVMQCEHATLVGGFQQWRKAGRHVRKGEHGISIWIPKTPKEDEHKRPGEISSKDLEMHFFVGVVFDVSQTEASDERQPAGVVSSEE